jgi:hypothetical protein
VWQVGCYNLTLNSRSEEDLPLFLPAIQLHSSSESPNHCLDLRNSPRLVDIVARMDTLPKLSSSSDITDVHLDLGILGHLGRGDGSMLFSLAFS